MKIQQKKFTIIGLLILYIVSVLTVEWLSDIISPVFSFVVFGIIIATLRYFKRFRLSYFIVALIPFIWGTIDLIAYVLSYYMNTDPSESIIIQLIYILPNILLCVSAIIYFINNRSRWHSFQLLIDAIVLITIVTGISSAIFFSQFQFSDYTKIEITLISISISADILALSSILIMISSTRLISISKTKRYVTVGFLIYIINDLFYIDSALRGFEYPLVLSRILFLSAFLHFGLGALHINDDDFNIQNNIPSNYGKSNVIWYVTLAPILLFVFNRVNLEHMLVFAIVVFIYLLFSHFAQKAMLSELQLNQEQVTKEELERLIAEKTQDLRQSRDALERKTITDSLTHLFNRDYFYHVVNEEIGNNNEFSIIYTDLNRFKIINDLHGHQMGDAILKVLAKKLASRIDVTNDIFRVGGDEFVVLMRSTEETTIKNFCDDFIELIEEPIKVDDYQFKVTTSIGIARYPYDGNQISDLIKHADIAMYHAKSLGGSQKHMHFSKQMIEKIKRRNKIELLLKNAKFDQEFELYYQPQVDTITGQLTGMEALLRWHHPDEGFISPGEFIPISEEIGLISDISQWVFKTAMSQMKLWYDRYDQELMMGLNLSPLIINNIRFFERLRALVDLTGVNPNHIEFEITEHSAMSTATIMEEVFSSLSDIGFHISIDDFGTGYSSLSYLKRFSIDRIKIAKELIENLPADSDDLHIVKAIVMMAEGMGLKTIGEGVETKDQLDILRTIGCDCIQGYYFGTPMPAEAFERKYFNETFEL